MRLAIIFSILVFSLTLQNAGTLYAEGERFAEVKKVKGDAYYRSDPNGEWQKLEDGMVLKEMDEVKTEDGSRIYFHLDEDASAGKIKVHENALMRLSIMAENLRKNQKTTQFDLARGKLSIRAAKLRDGERFEIKTPTNVAAVRGTVFEVSVD